EGWDAGSAPDHSAGRCAPTTCACSTARGRVKDAASFLTVMRSPRGAGRRRASRFLGGCTRAARAARVWAEAGGRRDAVFGATDARGRGSSPPGEVSPRAGRVRRTCAAGVWLWVGGRTAAAGGATGAAAPRSAAALESLGGGGLRGPRGSGPVCHS